MGRRGAVPIVVFAYLYEKYKKSPLSKGRCLDKLAFKKKGL